VAVGDNLEVVLDRVAPLLEADGEEGLAEILLGAMVMRS
jgi:hypothetical protein